MSRQEHPPEVCKMYDLIAETQAEGHICMLVCRPGSEPNTKELKARGVVLGDLLVSKAETTEDVLISIELGVDSKEIRTFVI
jgi:hypothetical protein